MHFKKILYKGKSLFFEEQSVTPTSTFFVDESKIKKPDLEFKIPESNANQFFAGMCLSPSTL